MIDANAIHEALLDSLFQDEELEDDKPPANAVLVEGIVLTFGFHRERLQSHRQQVQEWIADLPTAFLDTGGGGWSFLNLPFTADGTQWGDQPNAEELLCLALGLDLASYPLDRSYWNAFPGGVPYVVFRKAGPAELGAAESAEAV